MALTDTFKKISQPRNSAMAFFENKLRYEMGPAVLKEKMDRKEGDYQVIDVRTRTAYNQGHIPEARSIPYQELDEHMSEFSHDRDNIVYCYSITSQISYDVARKLAEKGYPAKVLIGGFEEWEKKRLPVETEPKA